MAINYIQRGDSLIYQNNSGKTIHSDDVILLHDRIGVALTDIDDGFNGAVQLSGVFSLAKASVAINQGQIVYWDVKVRKVTLTAEGNIIAGFAFESVIAADATIPVKLNS